ncbi:MAG: hypothetical protein AAF821_01455 [Cyanobacteria bacterium P01_D01_bin.156]
MAGRRKVILLLSMGSFLSLTNCQALPSLFEPSYESQLAEHLATIGAKMYGAYWCPHCARQRQLFGDAAILVPYVECDSRGVNPQVTLCNTVGITAYPTWEIGSGFYLGTQSLRQLAQLSGFTPPSESASRSDSWGSFSPAL